MANISQIELPSGDTFDIVDQKSGYITGMTILSYGSSTWSDFIEAYNAKKVVYCRASSNANPASGSQTRLAFMAYVSNADNPTNVEFQYYRSVSSHTASQQGDQVYVYKLDKTAGWTVTTRETSVKININANHDGIETTYSSGTVSIGHANSVTAQTTSGIYPIKIDKNGHISEYGSAVSVPTQAIDIGAQPTLVSGTNIKTINNNSILGSGNIDIQGAYIVTFTYDESEDVYTCDKTSQEIYEACISGENVVGVSYYGDPTSDGEFYNCKYVSKEVEDNINYYYAKFCSVEVEGGHAGSLILFVSNSGVRYESDFIYPITNIEGENWSNTITLDNGEGTASIQMNDRILDKTATIYWSTGDGANDSSTITLEAEKITLDADEILTSFNYTPTLANHFVNKGYVDTVINNKQNTLVSGTNIKTINNESLLGNGNLNIEGVPHVDLTQTQYDALSSVEKNNGTIYFITDGEPGGSSSSNSIADVRVNNTSVVSNRIANIDLTGKQDTLISGTNIKTINNTSLLGNGNISTLAENANGDISVTRNISTGGRATTADMSAQEISSFVNTVPSGFDNLTNLSVTNNITAGGDVTDGNGNVLSDKQDKYSGYGSEVDLSSYTSSTNYYTAPSDGIIRFRANVGTSNFIQCKVANNNGTNESLFSVSGGASASGIIPAPIFKGQRTWITARSAAADTSFVFIPFIT